MNPSLKRKDVDSEICNKRIRKECSYGDQCYRRNPAHFREFSHSHLEKIIDTFDGENYVIPQQYMLQRASILEQIEIIMEKQLYTPKNIVVFEETTNPSSNKEDKPKDDVLSEIGVKTLDKNEEDQAHNDSNVKDSITLPINESAATEQSTSTLDVTSKTKDPDYRPVVPPTRPIASYFKVVAPRGKMAAKHAASAPYHIFYTTIDAAPETHRQKYSITFQELLDPSLGELKCSLQINFMVELGWLLAHYYFAGYSNKKLTILYGEDSHDLRTISQKKPHIDAHHVKMATPFGKHHTKMMLLCYEDGGLRVVVSTANLYLDDWENRTQGLWLSPRCGPLPGAAAPHAGDSPTGFKRDLLRYLAHYAAPHLVQYIERVKRCDFSAVNVFLVASVPGAHSDGAWGMARVRSLLRGAGVAAGAAGGGAAGAGEGGGWALVAQASSLGSFGKEPALWLTGDFLRSFAPAPPAPAPLPLLLVYPSLENVRRSHDGLLGGGCLPYAAECHARQPWLRDYLYQWRATHTGRDRAMPHIKSYALVTEDGKMAAYYLLTSGNVSKAAWGVFNKGNGALRIMSYEAGVLFLPKYVLNAAAEHFPLDPSSSDHLTIPYDLPPTRYTADMSPWVSDHLR